MSRTRGKILVIRGGAIGDFVLTTPALRALREHFPETRVELLGYPHIAQLALRSGLVDEVRSIEARPLATFFARGGKLDPEMAEYFGSFPLIISYLFDPDLIFQQNVALASAAQFLAGPHRPSDAARIHATEVFLKPLERLAIFEADPQPSLRFPNAQPSCAPVVALHPGSGSEAKNWPIESWLGLASLLLQQTSAGLLIVGGEADEARLRAFGGLLQDPRVTIFARQPLAELATNLQSVSAFVGHDSGISHIAAAVGVPTVALWGATEQAVWQPLGPNVRVLKHPGGLSRLSVDRVWAEIQPLLNR